MPCVRASKHTFFCQQIFHYFITACVVKLILTHVECIWFCFNKIGCDKGGRCLRCSVGKEVTAGGRRWQREMQHRQGGGDGREAVAAGDERKEGGSSGARCGGGREELAAWVLAWIGNLSMWIRDRLCEIGDKWAFVCRASLLGHASVGFNMPEFK